jgi:hypothetical protein
MIHWKLKLLHLTSFFKAITSKFIIWCNKIRKKREKLDRRESKVN